LALQQPVNHGGLIPHAFSQNAVADTNPEELFFAAIGSGTTSVVRDAPAMSYLEGRLLSYISVPRHCDCPPGRPGTTLRAEKPRLSSVPNTRGCRRRAMRKRALCPG
jgi:hypothetical protein